MSDSPAPPKSALQVTLRPELPDQIYFFPKPGYVGPSPEDQAKLQIEIDEAVAVVHARFKDSPPQFQVEFQRLLAIAHGAFSSEYAQVEQARASLQAYKRELVRRVGPTVKNAYQKELAKAAIVASLLLVIAGVLLRVGLDVGRTYGLVVDSVIDGKAVVSVASAAQWNAEYSPLHLAFLLAACMWGIWLSFSVRSMDFAFEQLQHPESDMMRPWSRLLTFGLLALILALFFQMGILVISIGGFSTNQISSNLLMAIFVGLSLGFIDRTLPAEVRRRIDEFLNSAKRAEQ
jgi:hypothetical protein